MNNFGIFAFALVSVCIIGSSAQSHNITWGNIRYNDQLLHREIVQKTGKFMQIVAQNVSYPDNDNYNSRIITGIRVTDQYTNDKGGYATLLKGGNNYKYVTIQFKSQRGHGFNFIVEIYTR